MILISPGLIVFLGECAAKELAFWYELSLPAYQFPQAVRLVIAIMTMASFIHIISTLLWSWEREPERMTLGAPHCKPTGVY